MHYTSYRSIYVPNHLSRRSKWALWKFTIGHKSVRRLTAYKLIGSSIRWFLCIKGLNMNDTRAFLEHAEFASVRAMHDDKDSTHVEYDLTIHRLAEWLGFEAFCQALRRYEHKALWGSNMINRSNYVRRALVGGITKASIVFTVTKCGLFNKWGTMWVCAHVY